MQGNFRGFLYFNFSFRFKIKLNRNETRNLFFFKKGYVACFQTHQEFAPGIRPCMKKYQL